MLRTEINRKAIEHPQDSGRVSGIVVSRISSGVYSVLGPQHSVLVMAILLIAMTLSSCGFQLRGQAAIPYKTLFIETTGFSQFANDLERAIRSGSRTKVVHDRPEAEAVLKIIGESQEARIVALSSAGRVLEFELHYRVSYRLIDPAGKELASSGQIDLTRDMTYDDTQVLAKESEQLLLFRDMKSDAIQQMLRRLSVAKPVT